MLVETEDYGSIVLYECPSCGYKLYKFKRGELNLPCPECEDRARNEKYIERINSMIAPSGFVAERIINCRSLNDKIYQIVEVSCIECGVINYYLLADIMEGNFKKNCNHNLNSSHNIHQQNEINKADTLYLAELTKQWECDGIVAKDMIYDLNGNAKFVINGDIITGRNYIQLINKYKEEPKLKTKTNKSEMW